jgi:hypothetical protein
LAATPFLCGAVAGAAIRTVDQDASVFGDVVPNKYLYHYTRREIAMDRILWTGELRLGPLASTNDPRESKRWLVSIASVNEQVSDEEFFRLVEETDRLIRNTTKLASFTRDAPLATAPPPNEVFARGFAHSRMWAQYGDAHRGVCLIFDRELLTRRVTDTLAGDGDLYHGPVHYENRPHMEIRASELDYGAIHERGLVTVVEQHVKQHHQGLFFVKNTDWASEWEYRYLFRNQVAKPAFVAIQDSLVGAVLGEDFPLHESDAIRELLNDSEVPPESVAHCTWRNGVPIPLPAYTD